jgi:hypothetical protein
MPPGKVPFAAWPSEPAAWIALALAFLALVGFPLAFRKGAAWPVRWWLVVLAAAACALSALYVHFYLRGGPRIIDATSYLLEARALSHGSLTWHVPEPTASFRGRFLLARWPGPGAELGVIFPPGYPAVLALGVLLHAPMAVGPAIGALLVTATALLTLAVSGRRDAAMLAALMSTLCAALRYHTADTMSHGVAALALTTAVALALHARDVATPRRRAALHVGAGLALGWLAATRPVSAAAAVAVGALLLSIQRDRSVLRDVPWLAAGALGPVMLLAAHQFACTHALLASSQRAYYALSDGPPGCFRYGFGRGVGCLVEHGTYVQQLLPDGYGLAEAARVTARRLVLHVEDVLNLPMAVALVPIGAWIARGRRRVRLAAGIVAALVLAYAPFYFDGNYPGAGARLLAEAIPFEHVLASLALCWWADRLRSPARMGWAAGAISSAMFLGFALFNAPKHAALRDRDGGRPFFVPEVIAAAGVDRGLLFIDSDHGFNAASEPSVLSPDAGVVVARARHDDHDRLLWESLGRPPAWVYRWNPWEVSPAPPRVDRWTPPILSHDEWVFEAEAEWPPLGQSGGYAAPTWLAPGSCVSSGLALAIHRTDMEQACVTVEVPLPGPERWVVTPSVILDGPSSVRVEAEGNGERVRWALPDRLDPATWQGAERSVLDGRWCVSLGGQVVGTTGSGRRVMTVCTTARWLAVDKVVLRRPPETAADH